MKKQQWIRLFPIFWARKPSIFFLLIALVSLSACATWAPRPEIKDNPIKADPELIKKIQAKGWLEMDCNAGHVSMKRKDFEECVLVDAALLEPFDPQNPDHFGKDYDPEKFYECRINSTRADMKCQHYKLVRDEPEPVWPYPDVPPIQWPGPPQEQVYYPGISREDYFRGLCKKEAGKFIYRTVDNVEGIYQIRPQYTEITMKMRDPYVMESPYHFAEGDATRPGLSFLGNQGYQFYETSLFDPYSKELASHVKKHFHPTFREKASEESKYFRYEGTAYDSFKTVKRVDSKGLKSRYGYVWRGIKRPYDREMGIAGGELAVVDLKTNEILGLWRGFIYTSLKKGGRTWWLGGIGCPGKPTGSSRSLFKFVSRVVKPAKK